MEYIIVRVEWPESTESLARKVQTKVEEGFEPLGGMSTCEDKMRGRIFTQTMVKLDEPPIVQIDSPIIEGQSYVYQHGVGFLPIENESIDPNTGEPYADGVGW